MGKKWHEHLERPNLNYGDIFDSGVGQKSGLTVWLIDNFLPVEVDSGRKCVVSCNSCSHFLCCYFCSCAKTFICRRCIHCVTGSLVIGVRTMQHTSQIL